MAKQKKKNRIFEFLGGTGLPRLSQVRPQGRQARKHWGNIIIYEVIILFVFSTVMLAVLSYATLQLKVIRSSINREMAFQIAEAGTNYYQWRLSHYPDDYQDGTGAPGPYVHDYIDRDTGQVVGRYSLEITPPLVGSTIVTITSTGYTLANPFQRRTVVTRYGVPSLAQYAFLTNSTVWIGDSESVDGRLHANNGIRFDGTGNAPIQSARDTYTCPSSQGSPCPVLQPGIWGSADQTTKNFWEYPVPTVDFSTVTSDLATIKNDAQIDGIYLPPSNRQGYSLVFNNNNTVTVYRVNTLRSHATGWDVNGNAHNEDLDYNGRGLLYTAAIPANGLIYVEDRTWVEGTIAGRVLVAAARLPYNPSTAPSILIPNNIVYTVKDGSVSLGLIAQKDILVTYYVPNTLEVNAALIAQNGSAQRYYFPGNLKTSITIYGSIMSFGVWTWSWVNGSGVITSGYQNTQTTYDANLLYSPPPNFPLSSSGYQQISWSSN
ncbi:MAG: hypothetical protein AAB871_00325 [Patescibacteria group bacterium]